LGTRRRDVRSDDCTGPRNEREAERASELCTPGQIFLDYHKGPEDQHPTQATCSDREHQEHERPAARDAESTVTRSEEEGVPRMERWLRLFEQNFCVDKWILLPRLLP
jgi:hypothetical protein